MTSNRRHPGSSRTELRASSVTASTNRSLYPSLIWIGAMMTYIIASFASLRTRRRAAAPARPTADAGTEAGSLVVGHALTQRCYFSIGPVEHQEKIFPTV